MGSGCSCAKKKAIPVRTPISMKGRTGKSHERMFFRKFMKKSAHIRQLVGMSIYADEFSNLDKQIPRIEYLDSELDEDIQCIDPSEMYIEIKEGSLHQHVQRGAIREFPNKQYELKLRNVLIDEEIDGYIIKGDLKICKAVTESIRLSQKLSISTDTRKAMNFSSGSGSL